MRILLAGGGTGGHIYPALAIAERIKYLHPAWEILYVGTEKVWRIESSPKGVFLFRPLQWRVFREKSVRLC